MIRTRYKKPRDTLLSRVFATLIVICCAQTLIASGQSMPFRQTTQQSQLVLSDQSDEPGDSPYPSWLKPVKPLELQASYRPITRQESFRWFITGTIGLPHRAGGILVSGFGTAFDRPKEYGPHWEGFASRYGMRMACSATGNAIEAGAGLLLREDPRYFRVPGRPLNARVANVMRLTFAARGGRGKFKPAYARYMAMFGVNFLSDKWRVRSEANAGDAFLRTSGDFAGRMAANAFEEFWPGIEKRLFHKLK